MNLATYVALQESIEHWERVVESPESEAVGMGRCALCRRFNPFYSGGKHGIAPSVNFVEYSTRKEGLARGGCKGCPVAERTGRNFCAGTPYEDVEALEGAEIATEYLDAAKAELSFLCSLLPKAGEEVTP